MTSFKSPGLPVYKANIIPFIENGQQTYTKEMTEEHVNKLDNALDSLKQFIQALLKYGREENEVERLELIGDMISFYLKAPLIRPPLLGLSPAPYLLYPIIRIGFAKIESFDPIEFLSKMFDYSDAANSVQQHLLNNISTLSELWFTIPADTRPINNTSSLFSHLLLTSSIAWSYAVNRGYGREDAAKLRLAAMFHDMSKPYDFREHYKISDEILEKVLSDLLSSRQLDELKKFVREHHFAGETSLSKILKEADSVAASSERLARLVPYIFGQMNDIDFGTGYGSGKSAWDFWRILHSEKPDLIRRLSEDAAKRLSDLDVLKKLSDMTGSVSNQLRLCQIDIGGIQEFIMRTRELRSVAASSLLVDTVTSTMLPFIIQQQINRGCSVWTPLEAFIVVSGGALTLLLPEHIAYYLENMWSKIALPLERIGLRTYFSTAAFTGNYHRDSAELAKTGYIKKLTAEPAVQTIVSAPVSGAAPSLCKSCHRDPPTRADGRCDICGRLHDVGGSIHFKTKWNNGVRVAGVDIVPREVFGDWRDDPSFDVMYVVAGHSIPSQEPGERARNVAVVKMDGNLMGEFFANSVSISDMIERSARVEIALKDALEKSLADLFNGLSDVNSDDARRSVASCFLGLLYAGGDDALLLCPSWCSILLAQRTAHYFAEAMGRVRTLSIGIASAPPRHDVWALIDAASKLLNNAKNKWRKPESGGGVAFDYIEGGILSSSTVRWRKKLAETKNATLQPFSMHSLREFFDKLNIPLEGPQAFAYAYQASRKDDNEEKKYLKGLRQKVVELSSVSQSIGISGQKPEVLVMHLARMASVAKDDEKEKYRKLLRLVSWDAEDMRPIIPSFDVDVLIKFLGGGMI